MRGCRFADEDCAAAVERGEDDQGGEKLEGQIAEKELGYEWSDEEEGHGSGDVARRASEAGRGHAELDAGGIRLAAGLIRAGRRNRFLKDQRGKVLLRGEGW